MSVENSCCLIFLWKEQHLFEIEIFCCIKHVFTFTFDQFKASLLNKIIHLLKKDPKPLSSRVYISYTCATLCVPQGRIIRRCWRSCRRVTGYRVQIAAPRTSTASCWNAGTRRLPNGPRFMPFTVSWKISTPESTSKPLRCRRGGLKQKILWDRKENEEKICMDKSAHTIDSLFDCLY